MKRLVAIAAVALIGALAVPSLASANLPSYQDRLDAKTFARAYWEARRERGDYLKWKCDAMELKFEAVRRAPGILGYVNMDSDQCLIHLNSRETWNWSKLCTTVTHEWGHVLGVRHNSTPSSIMYPTYPNPLWGTRFDGC